MKDKTKDFYKLLKHIWKMNNNFEQTLHNIMMTLFKTKIEVIPLHYNICIYKCLNFSLLYLCRLYCYVICLKPTKFHARVHVITSTHIWFVSYFRLIWQRRLLAIIAILLNVLCGYQTILSNYYTYNLSQHIITDSRQQKLESLQLLHIS